MNVIPRMNAQPTWIGVVATLGMLCGTLFQFSIASLAPFIVEDLSISRATFGLTLAVLFAVSALASGPAGRIADRYPLRWALPTFFVVCAAVQVIPLVPSGLVILLVAAGLGGIPLAFANPLTNRLVSVTPVGKGRGLVIGIKQSGGQIGAVVAGVVLPSLATVAGWQLAVAGGALVALAGLVSTRFLGRSRGSPEDMYEGRDSGETDRGTITTLGWYSLFMGAAHSVFVGYLTLFAFDAVGASPRKAGAVTAVLGVAAFGGRITWGVRAVNSGRHRQALTVAPLLAVAGLALVALGPISEWMLFAGAVLVGATGLAWSSLITAAVVARSSRDRTGRLSGSVIRPAFIAFAVAPPAFGVMVDAIGSYTPGWIVVGLMLIAASVMSSRLPEEARRR